MKERRKRPLFGKRLAAGVLAGGMALIMAGCGSAGKFAESIASSGSSFESAPTMNGGAGIDGVYTEESLNGGWSVATAPEEGGRAAEVMDSSRKLIRTVYMDVETKEFEHLMATLEGQVEGLGGYIENMDTYNGSSYSYSHRSRYANMTVRIPQKDLGSFLNTVSQVGNVVSRSESVEDVTLTYVDMASRKDSLLVEQERLLSFLEQAESIEDIITIESRLSQVRYQIESMESQLRTYDNQVDYSTVHLSVSEVQELTPVEEKTAWQRMGDGFADSVKSIVNGFAEVGIWFVVHIPFLVMWMVVIALAVVIVKLIIRRARRKKAKRDAEGQQETRGPALQENGSPDNITKK